MILGWFENLCTSLQRPLIPGMLHRFMHFPPKTVNPRNVAQVYALPSKGFLIPEMLRRFVHFPPKTFNPWNVAQVCALPSKDFLTPGMLHRFVHFPPKTFNPWNVAQVCQHSYHLESFHPSKEHKDNCSTFTTKSR